MLTLKNRSVWLMWPNLARVRFQLIFDAQNFVGYSLDMQGDTPAVHGTLIEAFQNKKSQGPLQVVAFCSSHRTIPLDVYRRMPPFGCRVKFARESSQSPNSEIVLRGP
jgi:hypothetical protein